MEPTPTDSPFETLAEGRITSINLEHSKMARTLFESVYEILMDQDASPSFDFSILNCLLTPEALTEAFLNENGCLLLTSGEFDLVDKYHNEEVPFVIVVWNSDDTIWGTVNGADVLY